jgi:hypothetical protein
MTGDVQLTEGERQALSDLRRDVVPPEDIEPRLVRDLRQHGLLVATPRGWVYDWRAVGALGVCAGLAIGLWMGTVLLKPPRTVLPTNVSTQRFMLLLYEDAAYEPAANPSDRVREYTEWARSLGRAGQLVTADELGDHGQELTKNLGPTNIKTQAMGAQPRGYFIIGASDEAAALRLASTCPHLQHGGRIVMLPIVP